MYHHSAKEFFISALGLERDYSHTLLLTHDLKLQRKGEREPFGELVTTPSGTILRIGATLQDGIRILL